jgi:hypothetical protein
VRSVRSDTGERWWLSVLTRPFFLLARRETCPRRPTNHDRKGNIFVIYSIQTKLRIKKKEKKKKAWVLLSYDLKICNLVECTHDKQVSQNSQFSSDSKKYKAAVRSELAI